MTMQYPAAVEQNQEEVAASAEVDPVGVPEDAAVQKDQHGAADLQMLVLQMLEAAAHIAEALVAEPEAQQDADELVVVDLADYEDGCVVAWVGFLEFGLVKASYEEVE